MLIKNVSSSKGDIFEKSYDFNIKEISPALKDNKSELFKTELKDSYEDITPVSSEKDKTENENLQEPVENNRTNENLKTSAESQKDTKPSLVAEENVNANNRKTVTINDTPGDMRKPSPRKKKTFNFIEIITPRGSFNRKQSPKINTIENVHAVKGKTVTIRDSTEERILPSSKDEKAYSSSELIELEEINKKASLIPNGGKNKDVENDDKSNDESVKKNEPRNDLLCSIKNEFLKAKDSISKMLRFDKYINPKDDVNNTKDHAKSVILTSNTDVTKDSSYTSTSKICKEPSSLFFTTLTPCTPSTPKEMFEPYENTLKSGKTETCDKNTIPATEFKHAGNVTISTSKVIRDPEIPTSHVQTKEDTLISKLETGKPVSHCNVNELHAAKDNLLKSTSRVTFAKNEIIIKDSVSKLDHVCVVNPVITTQDDCMRMCSYESEVDSENSKLEEPTTANIDKTVKEVLHNTAKDSANPFKSKFINEIVTLTNIFDPSHRNEAVENITDTYDYDLAKSQTSFNLQPTKKTEKGFHRQVDNLNSKLVERLSEVINNKELASRSLATVFKNEDSTSSNVIQYSEVIIVDNKLGDNKELLATKTDKTASETIVEIKKDITEMKDNIESLSKFLKSVQDITKVEKKNNEDNDKNAGS
ncbi:hypothetical protein O0L34_g622 [Tuta absoluta]|nr:hypothetical protein O0L34_g622 [Tuta absoluta]